MKMDAVVKARKPAALENNHHRRRKAKMRKAKQQTFIAREIVTKKITKKWLQSSKIALCTHFAKESLPKNFTKKKHGEQRVVWYIARKNSRSAVFCCCS